MTAAKSELKKIRRIGFRGKRKVRKPAIWAPLKRPAILSTNLSGVIVDPDLRKAEWALCGVRIVCRALCDSNAPSDACYHAISVGTSHIAVSCPAVFTPSGGRLPDRCLLRGERGAKRRWRSSVLGTPRRRHRCRDCFLGHRTGATGLLFHRPLQQLSR